MSNIGVSGSILQIGLENHSTLVSAVYIDG